MSRKEAILAVLYALEDTTPRLAWHERAFEILEAMGVTDAEIKEAFLAM